MENLYDKEINEYPNDQGDARIILDNIKIPKNVPHVGRDLGKGDINGL